MVVTCAALEGVELVAGFDVVVDDFAAAEDGAVAPVLFAAFAEDAAALFDVLPDAVDADPEGVSAFCESEDYGAVPAAAPSAGVSAAAF